MHNRSRYSLLRRLLFPYSGEEPLTRAEGGKVIITWALFFACALLIATLPVEVALQVASLQKLVVTLLLVFCGGMLIFGLMAWLVVFMNNQSAQFRQKQKTQNAAGTSSTNRGGRYGS